MTDDEISAFHRDGYLIVEELFDAKEIELLHKIGQADLEQSNKRSIAVSDANGATSKLWLRHELEPDTIYSAIVGCPRLADNMQRLLGEKVYHFHHKMMLKEPRVGGAWEWHQDYGYWYNDGYLFPNMASCMIAVDPSTKANGCLQVIKGTHLLGRIEHGTYGQQAGADPARVEFVLQHCQRVYVEMTPGSAVFFHCNTLHGSEQNKSDNPRWSFISCYNSTANPCKSADKRLSQPAPLLCCPDEEVSDVGERHLHRLLENVMSR